VASTNLKSRKTTKRLAERLGVKRYLVPFALATFGIAGWALLSGPRASVQGGQPQSAGVTFGPTIPNRGSPPGAAFEGMLWISGGEFSMGAQDAADMNHVGMNGHDGFPSRSPRLRGWLLYG